MRNTFKYLSVCSFLLLLIMGCKKEQAPTVDMGYGYFPSQVGKYVIYSADSIVRDPFTLKTDTFIYQLKELVAAIFPDNQGRPTMRVERYVKNYGGDTAWVLKNVWMANLTSLNAQKVESNTRYVKLAFPVVSTALWNGNAFNTQSAQNYYYSAVNVPLTLGGMFFDSTCTIIQLNDSNLLSKQYYVETYAKNVGMIYKQVINVSTDSIRGVNLLQNPYASGTLNYTLVVKGHN